MSEAVQAGWLSSRGPFVDRFEKTFRERVGRQHALAVTNGTAAVHLALVALKIGPGDEIIVPDFCMMAPVFAVLYCGANPVPVDVDRTWNLDPTKLESAMTGRTRAILVVHNYGHPAKVSDIQAIAQSHSVPIIEDAAEALGATADGRPVGANADVTCYSFYANKVITTGEGGMITLNDPVLYKRARWKRDMCFGADDESRFLHEEIGFNYRMTNVQAAIGLAQLEHLDEAVRSKQQVAIWYNARLSGVPGLTLPPLADWATQAYWVYGILIGPEFGINRQALQKSLARCGIETRRFFAPLHTQPFFRGDRSAALYPQSQRLWRDGLYLPSFVGMTEGQVDRVATTIDAIRRSSHHRS